MNFIEPVEQDNQPSKKKILGLGLSIIAIVVLSYGALMLGLAYNEIVITSDGSVPFWNRVSAILSFPVATVSTDPTPKPDPNRLDILILGMRGLDDPDALQGGMLTDTILLFSYDKTTAKSSLVSIPRDLYIKIDKYKMGKVNEVYEYGLSRKEGLDFTKRVFSIMTGTHIDNVIVFDFTAFRKIVDELDGVDIYLDKPFEEKSQWGSSFYLPAGINHLNGESALYYARSRYSTSDFDRSRRQQEIIMAIKDKVMTANLTSDPLKAFGILNSVRSDIKTDLNIWNLSELINLYQQVKKTMPKEYVISTGNLLYQTYIDSMYVLLPNGENFDLFKKFFAETLN